MFKEVRKSILFFGRIFLILPIFLISDTIDIEINNAISSYKQYIDAINSYNEKDYKSTYNGLSLYLKDNSSNKRINFILGRSAFELKRYKEALISYEKVLLEDPNNNRAYLEMAKTYFVLKKYKKARKQFNFILKQEIPDIVRSNIEKFIQKIDLQKKKHFLKKIVIFGFSYDTNTNNNADKGNYTIYIPELSSSIELSNNKEKVTGKAMLSTVILNHKYKVKDNISSENNLVFYSQNHHNNHEKDIGVISVATTMSYLQSKYKVSMGFSYDFVSLDNKSYIKSYSIVSMLNKKLSNNIGYLGYLKYNKQLFVDKINQTKDSNTIELLNSIIIPTKLYGTNSLALILGKTYKENGVRTDINKYYYNIKLSNSYNLSKSLIIKVKLNQNIIKYKDNDVNFIKKRDDKQYNSSLGLVKLLNKNLSIDTNIQYIKNKSNHSPFKYDKYILKTNIIYNF